MRKVNRHIVRMIILSVMFVVVLTASIATSSARFRTMVSTNSSNNVAGWNFIVAFNDEEVDTSTTRTVQFNLADFANPSSLIKQGTIAPGSSGAINLTLDCTACQVDVRWTVVLSEIAENNYPENLIFWTTSKADPLDLGVDSLTGQIDFDIDDQSSQTSVVVLNWEWVLDLGEDETEFAGKTFSYRLDITAEQIQPGD